LANDRSHVVVRAGTPARDGLCGEPTLEELLDDSVLRTLLRSDGIDPKGLRVFLRELRRHAHARERHDTTLAAPPPVPVARRRAALDRPPRDDVGAALAIAVAAPRRPRLGTSC
jgi:hypothetical protein